ncbi:MAG: PAS domain-containing protein, partial [Anaerolineales bacterium]|nr:PAS domain-containing protein [Anaerolineales bacterium]
PWSRLLQTQIYRGLFGDWVLRQETAVANLNLSIIVETPITTAYAPILQMIYETIGFLIVVAIIALSLGYYFSHKIVIPLRQLSMAAARISDGDMSVQLDVDSRNEFGLVAAAFNRMTAQLHETVSTLEKSVEERTTTINRRSLQIQAAAATARDATSATELNELLNRAVNLVPSRFGYYHAGIFLVDESEKYAVLRAATGTVGQEMLRRQHRLLVGSEGIVGHVIATGSPYITSDTHRDPVYWPNPLLPETRSEMGLPLRVGDRVIGAMNVQSRKTSAFEEEDITILQILTDQLAVAIEKTRLFEKTQAMLTERLHTIVSNIPLMLFAFDRQGSITLAEGKGLAILNVESVNFIGKSVFDIFHQEPIILGYVHRALHGETIATTINLRNFTWDVRYIPVLDAGGVLTGVIGVAADITERRRAEESLREKERQLRQIIDLVPHMIFARDMDGRYLLVNQSVANAYETTVDAITGSRCHEWHRVPAELKKFLQDDQEVITTGLAKFIAEDMFTDAQGRQHTLQTSKIPLAWDGGVKTAVLGVSVDITERKQAEEALRQAQKLESLGILAGGVAHDFNNLLVAILGQTSLALVRLPKESPARQAIEKATRAAERAADLTRQLLAYSGRGHFEVQPLNLNTLLQENLHLFEVAVSKNVLLRPEFTEPLPLIEADAGQMQQIIMNLILNGADAIGSETGTVTVVTSVQSIDANDRRHWRYTGEPLSPGQYVSLEVHDSGQGMDSQTLSKIFDPFFTTKKTGRGLGLAAVLGIVRGHRGGIRVYSEVGKGTTFKILFPAIAQSSANVSHAESAAESITQSGLILVIDDEQSVRETAADILQEEGFVVVSAVDGQQGLEMYQERMEEILLVLLDLSMPGLSGEETFRHLRQLNPDVHVILSSGYNQVEATRHFVGKGLAGFLQKPYSAQQLATEIRKRLNLL